MFMSLCAATNWITAICRKRYSGSIPQYPDSTIALNLRACNGRVAEQDIKNIVDNGTEFVKCNLVVFRNGAVAFQVKGYSGDRINANVSFKGFLRT